MMETRNKALLSHKEFCKAAGVIPRRLIDLCEKGVVRAEVDPGGRGNHRYFSKTNLIEFKVASVLLDQGLTVRAVASFTRLLQGLFTRLSKTRRLPADVPTSLLKIAPDELVWLVIFDRKIATLRFPKDKYTPYIKLQNDGGLRGTFPWRDRLERTAFTRFEVNLGKAVSMCSL